MARASSLSLVVSSWGMLLHRMCGFVELLLALGQCRFKSCYFVRHFCFSLFPRGPLRLKACTLRIVGLIGGLACLKPHLTKQSLNRS